MDVGVTSSRTSEGRTMQDAYMDIGGRGKQDARAEEANAGLFNGEAEHFNS
jgi:hypothetical protein